MHNNVNAVIVVQIKMLLNSFHLCNKVIMYVKNEWLNLIIFTFALTCESYPELFEIFCCW
jgi:hypothetical protein